MHGRDLARTPPVTTPGLWPESSPQAAEGTGWVDFKDYPERISLNIQPSILIYLPYGFIPQPIIIIGSRCLSSTYKCNSRVPCSILHLVDEDSAWYMGTVLGFFFPAEVSILQVQAVSRLLPMLLSLVCPLTVQYLFELPGHIRNPPHRMHCRNPVTSGAEQRDAWSVPLRGHF